jgi:hypothetical protein
METMRVQPLRAAVGHGDHVPAALKLGFQRRRRGSPVIVIDDERLFQPRRIYLNGQQGKKAREQHGKNAPFHKKSSCELMVEESATKKN